MSEKSQFQMAPNETCPPPLAKAGTSVYTAGTSMITYLRKAEKRCATASEREE